MFVSMPYSLASVVFLNLPTSATSDGNQYNSYTRIVMEPLYSETPILRLYLAIDAD
jgi:hypothetical protein